jgi:hypothetical protein
LAEPNPEASVLQDEAQNLGHFKCHSKRKKAPAKTNRGKR